MAAITLWLEIILDPWGVFSYLGGLINVPFSHASFLMTVPAASWMLLCPVVLLVRMLVVWPRRLRNWRRVGMWWGIVIGTFFIGFILPFRLPVARSRDAFMLGFERYVRCRVDVPAVQGWLATLKPGARLPGRASPDLRVEESDLPRPIARLKAGGWRVEFDDAGRTRIRLIWGTGVLGGWGLVVGDRQMETPASDYSRYGEVRRTIAPGAYIWYDVK